VLAVAETLGAGEGPPGAPWAEEAAAAQDLGCGIGEPGQVVEVLLANEILSVGIPDGERQPDPEVDLSPPCSAEAATPIAPANPHPLAAPGGQRRSGSA